jgi:hypothetical protein
MHRLHGVFRQSAWPHAVGSGLSATVHASFLTLPARPMQRPMQPHPPPCNAQPVGIPNTVSKYDPSRPLAPHVTPFERRVVRKLEEEEEVVRLTQRGSVERG